MLSQIVFFLVVIVLFFPLYWFFDKCISLIFSSISDRNLRSHVENIALASESMRKFKVEFKLIQLDFSFLDSSIPQNEKSALLEFFVTCEDYNVHYLYVVDKVSNKVIVDAPLYIRNKT